MEPPPAATPYTPIVSNQSVFNAVREVSGALKINLIGLMPHDLLDFMAARRDRIYEGPSVQGWGLTDEQKALVIEKMIST